jgi:tRNA(adenine34) deaminase
VPIGAVVVSGGAVVASGSNRRETDADPTAHAEMVAVREAARVLGRWRLSGCTVYVTLEPCPMCAGALHSARVDRCVFGATDPKAGAVGTLYDIASDERLNHRYEVTGGVLAEESSALLKAFFASLRAKGREPGPLEG